MRTSPRPTSTRPSRTRPGFGRDELKRATQDYNDSGALPYVQRTPEEIASVFDGLDLVEPGVVSCPRWRPDPVPAEPPAELDAFGGVARKRLPNPSGNLKSGRSPHQSHQPHA